MKKVWVVILMSIFVLNMLGHIPIRVYAMMNEKSNPSGNFINHNKSNTVRAEGKSDYGTLEFISIGKEKVEQLGADSSYGKASDFSFTGNYKVIFKNSMGKKKLISRMNNLNVIQPYKTTIKLQKLKVDGTDIFYFVPKYSSSNDTDIYFYGITSGGEAFKFKIENNKAQEIGDEKVLSDSTAVLSTTCKEYSIPKISNGKNIVLTAVYNIGAGQNLKVYKVTFSIDVKNRTFKYVAKREI